MDDVVRKYIDEVTALQARRAEMLTAADLADIARQVGLGDGELAAVDAEIAAHLVRAPEFAANEMWEDAQSETESAIALAPHDVEVLDISARVFARRWGGLGRSVDRERALDLARQVVRLDPKRTEAYRLIKELQRPRRRRPIVLAAGVAVAAAGGTVAWLATASAVAVVPVVLVVLAIAIAAQRARPQPVTVLPTSTASSRLLGTDFAVLADHPLADPSKLDIPIVLVDPANWESMAIQVRRRDSETFSHCTYCRLALDIRPRTNEQIDGLKARICSVAGDDVLFRDERQLIGNAGQAPALLDRPAVVNVLIEHEPAHPSEIRLELTSVSRGTPPRLPDSSLLKAQWLVPRPHGVKVEFRYRGETSGSTDRWRYLWWEVENVGRRIVDTLYCDTRLLSATGEVLQSWSDMVTYQDRALFPGETRLCCVLVEVPDEPWTFGLAVSAAG